MGDLSKIGDNNRLPVHIRVFAYLLDHMFESLPVFPAVESVQLLARAVLNLEEEMDVRSQSNAAFDKFLPMDERGQTIEAFVEFERLDNGRINAGLISRKRVSGSRMTRTKEHARICFDRAVLSSDYQEPPAAVEEETEIQVSAPTVYKELVPMGPAYQNLDGSVRLSAEGASAGIRAPDLHKANGPLGSPFVLDAAFHAACVWGQRYSGFIGFPVGFERRRVIKPAEPGGKYTARVVPTSLDRNENIFDLWIFGPGNSVFEVVEGLHMRDVTGGRKKPPVWIRETR
ncbi:MAG: polyketide synthase dehydratase domain-containing protein [Desulfobacteraceae bacterium]|nr:polyketide synthase dehydratase domain-containing protein [Desulfobacteraceae bacterium]MCF8094574.1 polyketide synthase dehydratase domain-containing protein [Desulfobacteraceae bacterium]